MKELILNEMSETLLNLNAEIPEEERKGMLPVGNTLEKNKNVELTEEEKTAQLLYDFIQLKEPSFPEIGCNRCGKCCEAFPLPYSPEEMEEHYRTAYKGNRNSSNAATLIAIWSRDLEPIPIPEQYKEQIKKTGYENNNNHWYRCKNHFKEVDDEGYLVSTCKIHEYRPNTCVRYAPHFQGGYLKNVDMIPYDECSYKKEWLRLLEELKEQVTKEPESVREILRLRREEEEKSLKEWKEKVQAALGLGKEQDKNKVIVDTPECSF